MIGTILSNRYKIIDKLGSGGMAWVYLAQDLLEERQVAVKVLYPQHSQDLAFLQRFMQEARLAMALCDAADSPHIVRVLDYGSDRDTHYLVMDYVPGQDLARVLEKRGPLPWQEALDIARQVALALACADEQGVVHRDVKPGNIMLGDDGTVRVLDFGIARALTSPELTLAGFVGSPYYAAPEQAMGETVDIRADLYSLGVVIYRMLSGELPFNGHTPWAIANQHIAATPPPLADRRPDLPEPVLHLVTKALAKRPEDRFQTPGEMVAALEAVLAGGDLPAGAETRGTPAQLYAQAQQALAAENWHRAVDLLNQVVGQDPDYRDAAGQLAKAGQQIRLEALYRAAGRSLQLGHGAEASTALDEIYELDPGYRDVAALRQQANTQQAREKADRAAAADYPTFVETPAFEIAPAHPEARPAAPAPTGARHRPNWLWVLIPALLVALIVVTVLLLRSGGVLVAAATATPTPAATATAPAPSSPTATRTPQPTVTLTPRPSSTPSRTPTSTPAATASATPTLTLTATAMPTSTPLPGQPTTPALSGQIAFPRFDTERQTYDVYACRVDGSNCRRLVAEASQPDFLPDGTQIVVHSWQPDAKGLVLHFLNENRIWRITGQIEAARPSVDFQGSAYVYHSRQEADREPRLYRTYGTETRPLQREAVTIVGLAPAWTPDGQILYSGCWRDSCGILLMRADGNNPRQVVAGSSETNPEASPAPLEGGTGGKQVAFMSQRDGNWEVYVVNLDGSDLQRLTRNPANDGLPTWSPDGRYLAFVSDRTGRWAVWVMRPDGSGQQRLFDINGPLDGQVHNAAPYEVQGWVEERISWGPVP
jgi:hypothetical protein